MKKLVVVLFAFWGVLGGAESFTPSTVIFTRNAAPCNFWSYYFPPNGGGGNLCSSYSYMEIPEASSVQNAISTLEARIEALEAKIKQLESSAQ